MTSATEEIWWPEFVKEYGKLSLRELARRFGTNPRRLRRAAQRAGLADEPQVVRDNIDLLGGAPDASVAQLLSVTAELIKGARLRREIPPFTQPQPGVQTPLSEPQDAPVVVRRAPSNPPAEQRPSGFRKVVVPIGPAVGERHRRPLGAQEALSPPSRDVRGEGKRRRVVPRPEREPLQIEPSKEAKPRRRQRRKQYAPVKTLFDRKEDEDIEPELGAAIGVPRPTALPRPSAPEAERPFGGAQPRRPVSAPERFWTARVEGREVIIRAPDVLQAAQLACGEGSVQSLDLVEVL